MNDWADIEPDQTPARVLERRRRKKEDIRKKRLAAAIATAATYTEQAQLQLDYHRDMSARTEKRVARDAALASSAPAEVPGPALWDLPEEDQIRYFDQLLADARRSNALDAEEGSGDDKDNEDEDEDEDEDVEMDLDSDSDCGGGVGGVGLGRGGGGDGPGEGGGGAGFGGGGPIAV